MKKTRLIKIFSIALIMSLLVLVLPAAPALAVNDLPALSPTHGAIGSTVNVTGDNFAAYKSTASDNYFAEIFFALDNRVVNNIIGTHVKTYEWLGEIYIDENGDFSGGFPVPTRLDDYSASAYHQNVAAGTYYIYVIVDQYPNVGDPVFNNIIRAKATFTVSASATLDPLSPTSGAAGSDVVVSGINFPVSTALVFKFDTTTLTPKSGHTQTTSGGLFLSTLTIPAGATAGNHTITVTAGAGTATATFTVAAGAALDPISPATGPPGTEINIVGSNFPASTALVFKFDTTTIPAKAGTDATTRTNGIFISTITVPAGVTAGSHIITVTAGAGTTTATFTVTANAVMDVSPESGAAGSDVYITGANFPASTTIVFKIDSTTIEPSGDPLTNTNGGFYSVIIVPEDTTAGDHTISVTVGTVVITATFNVTGTSTPTPTPTPTVTPPPSNAVINMITSGDSIGSQIGIAGAGFTPGADVTFKYDADVISTVKANSSGQVNSNFNAPPSAHGEHTITVSDGTNTTTVEFTVESQAPAAPETLLPESGEAVETPITFDWENATDDSQPVTYDFQIATDENFNAGSIILAKNDLTESEYMVTEAEGLELSDDASYYWRVKAVDGALNQSSWTAASDFLTGGSSAFPRWALILIIAAGAVVVFFLGFFIGRRTAYF